MSHNLQHNKRFLIHRRALPVLSNSAVVQGATPAVELTAPSFAADSGIVVASVVESSSVVVSAANLLASTTISTTTTTTTTVAVSPSATDGSFATSIIQDDPSVMSAPVTTTTAAAASVFSAGPALIAASQAAPGGLSMAARNGSIGKMIDERAKKLSPSGRCADSSASMSPTAAAAAIGLVLIAWVIYRGCRRRRARAALTASITSDSSSSLDGMTEQPRKALFLSPPSKAKTTRDFKSSFDVYTATSPGLTTPAGWATFSTTSIPGTINAGVGNLPTTPRQVQPSRWSASTFGDARISVRPVTPSTPPRTPPRSPPGSPPRFTPTTPRWGEAMTINPFDDRQIPLTPSPTPSPRGNSIKRKSSQMLPEIRPSVSDSESEEGDIGFMGTVFRPGYAMGRAAPVERSKQMQEVLESPTSRSKVMAGATTVLRVYNKGDVSDDE